LTALIRIMNDVGLSKLLALFVIAFLVPRWLDDYNVSNL